MILDLKQNYDGVHTKIVDEKNIEIAMLSQLFYTSTVQRNATYSKAYSSVLYCVHFVPEQDILSRHRCQTNSD